MPPLLLTSFSSESGCSTGPEAVNACIDPGLIAPSENRDPRDVPHRARHAVTPWIIDGYLHIRRIVGDGRCRLTSSRFIRTGRVDWSAKVRVDGTDRTDPVVVFLPRSNDAD